MAMSKLYPTEQFVLTVKCELCDSQENVNWFCKNCIKNLCDNCKKVHSKIPSLSTHEIITIGEGLRVDRCAKVLCKTHGELIQYRCETCSSDACPKCVAASHYKHDLIDMKSEEDKSVEKFKRFLAVKQNFGVKIRQCRTEIKKTIDKNNSIAAQNIVDINKRFDEIKNTKETFVSAIENQRNTTEKENLDKINMLLILENDLDSKIQHYSSQVSTESGDSLSRLIQKAEDDIKSMTFPDSVPVSRVSDLELYPYNPELTNFFGKLKSMDSIDIKVIEDNADELCHWELRKTLLVTSKFRCNKKWLDPVILCITHTKDGLAWISGIELFSLTNKSKVIKESKASRNSLFHTVLPCGEFLMSYGNGVSIIRRLAGSDQSPESIFVDAKETVYYILALDEDNIVYLTKNDENNIVVVGLNKNTTSTWRVNMGRMACYIVYHLALCVHPQRGTIIACNGREIFEIGRDGKEIQRKRIDSFVMEVGCLAIDRSNRFIFGSKDGGIFVFDDMITELTKIASEDINSPISALSIDPNGDLWLGTTSGHVYVTSYMVKMESRV